MKIGILTFHCAHNYGAVLQCYALQETLRTCGYTVDVIDYRPRYLTEPYKIFNIKRFINKNPLILAKRLIEQTIVLRSRIERYKAFQNFIDANIKLSKWSGRTSEGFPSDYDFYILGSDQIWNPKITKGLEPLYFGRFPFPKENRRYVIYAASMGMNAFRNVEEKEYIKQSLSLLDSISVRENDLAKLIQPLTTKHVEAVLDPTLLAQPDIWNKIAVKPNINRKYVLVYQVRENKNTVEIAKYLADKIGGDVIELFSNIRISNYNRKTIAASPAEFVGYIKYADYIVTTSFHGTVFSIIFSKPFYCIYLNDGADGRVQSLVNKLGLQRQMIDMNSRPNPVTINYECVDEKLLSLREHSKEFLINQLL